MMVSYVHGSAALDERSRQQQRVVYREKKKKVYKRSVVTPQEKLLWMFGVIVCVVVAGAILFRYAQIYEINTRIQQMEQEIRRIELENSTLKLEVAKLQDNKRLLEIEQGAWLCTGGFDHGDLPLFCGIRRQHRDVWAGVIHMSRKIKIRSFIIGGFFTLFFVLIAFESIWIQVVQADELVAKAERAWSTDIVLPSTRGAIYDRGGSVLAWNAPAYTVAVNPKLIQSGAMRAKSWTAWRLCSAWKARVSTASLSRW